MLLSRQEIFHRYNRLNSQMILGNATLVVMIHPLAGSIHPTNLGFQDEFPVAELVNVMDDSLLSDFG